MKTRFKLFRNLLTIASLMVLGVSCNQEPEAVTPAETREPITFSVANETITRGEIVSSITEFVVYAVDGDNVIINNATFTKDGDAWSTSATFYWTGNEISFYAYVPSDNFTAEGSMLSNYSMPIDVTEQDDLMVAKYTASSGAVILSFERIMALVKFSVKDASVAVTSVSISGISDAGEYNMATKEWFNGAATTTSYEAGIDQTIADGGDEGTQITDKSGYLMVLPQAQESIKVIAINANGKEKEYTLKNIDWKAGTLYNYTIDLEDIEPQVEDDGYEESTNGNDYTNKTDGYIDSNCYIIKSGSSTAQVYHLPIEGRINDYWTNYDSVAANQVNDSTRGGLTIGELWNDSGSTLSGIEVSLVLKEGKKVMQVKTEASFSTKCNAVYAVKNAAGTILWSWHLWLTDYTPIDTVMNRFVGQKTTTSITGAAIYQFGRKDPFVTSHYTTSSGGTYANGIYHPDKMYSNAQGNSPSSWAYDYVSYSDYNWGDSNNSTVSTKSIFDPSPYGYRLLTKSEAYSVVSNTSGNYPNYNTFTYNGNVLQPVASIMKSSYCHSLMNYEVAFWSTQAYSGISSAAYLARIYQMSGIGYYNMIREVVLSEGEKYYAYPVLSILE